MAVLLSFEQVSKRYPEGRGSTTVLDRVSLEIDAGDFVGLWGPRRAGKTTLLRIAAAIELPDEGKVCFDGHVVAELSRRERARLLRHRGIGLTSASGAPLSGGRAVEYVALPLLSDGISVREAEPLARRALERADATAYADLDLARLAVGERMRVELARALVHGPRLLLVDEPATLPSPRDAQRLYELLGTLGRSRELAVVIASEDVEALQGVSRMMSISDGVLRSTDAPGVVVRFARSN
jgi:ABC-type lipoprotein export system ATPase subunit